MFVFVFLILPGLVFLYALFIRPLLHRVPALAKFYADADGFWAKVWALCGNSLTILWGHVVALFGIVLSGLDAIAPLVGDPDLKSQVQGALQSNPQYLGYFSIAVAAVMIFARLRSIVKTVG